MEVEYKLGQINEVVRGNGETTKLLEQALLKEKNAEFCLVPYVFGVYQLDHRLEQTKKRMQEAGLLELDDPRYPAAEAMTRRFTESHFLRYFNKKENLPSNLISIVYDSKSMPRPGVEAFLLEYDVSKRVGIFSLDNIPEYAEKFERDFAKANETMNKDPQAVLKDPKKRKRMINYIEKYATELSLDWSNFGLTMEERLGLVTLRESLRVLREEPNISSAGSILPEIIGLASFLDKLRNTEI